MVAPARSTHFFLSFKLGSFIIVNDLEALHEIFRGDDRLNNCYSSLIATSRYDRCG